MYTIFGTDNIFVNKLDNGLLQFQMSSFNFDNIYLKETSEKLIINGQPLTVYKSSSGNYVLSCIIDNSQIISQSQTSILGNYYKTINNCLYINYSEVENINFSNKTYFFNLPLMIDDDKKLVISVKSGEIQQYSTTSIGGNNIKIGRIGNNWHIILYSISSQPSYLFGNQNGQIFSFDGLFFNPY